MDRADRKLTKLQRIDLDQLVLFCKLGRLTVGETQKVINEKLGLLISEDWINHIRGKYKTACKTRLLHLQRDQYDYIFHYIQRIDEVYHQQDEFWTNYKQLKDPQARINSLKEAREQTVLLTDLIEHLPIIAGLKVTSNDITQTQRYQAATEAAETEQQQQQPVF